MRRTSVKHVLLEAVFVAAIGVALAFVANGLSPQGIKLTRNYFPAGTNVPLPSLAVTEHANEIATTNAQTGPAPVLIVVPRLAEKGLQAIDREQATRFFDDARRQKGLIVFIDARADANYQEGHIPSAYQFDPYHPEKYLTTVLPVCQVAERVVVYCTGSDCEDSELGAILLRDAGLANQKIFVYVNGITEWTASALPVEIGARNSGNVRNSNK